MEVWGGSGASEDHFVRPGLDVWVWSQPSALRANMGGDLHFLSSCASGRITRALIADVCGLDSVFAELAAELRDLMARNVNAIKQSRLVRKANVCLHEYAEKGGFASVLVSTYFAPTRSLAVCNAGHPPPFLYRSKHGEWSVLKQDRPPTASQDSLPLDVLSYDEYQEFSTQLSDGDIVLCYSNPLTESRNESGQIMGVAGLLERVNRIPVDQPSQIVSTLIRALQAEHEDNLTEGDATVLLCRATQTTIGLKNNLLAPFRLLGRVSDNTWIG